MSSDVEPQPVTMGETHQPPAQPAPQPEVPVEAPSAVESPSPFPAPSYLAAAALPPAFHAPAPPPAPRKKASVAFLVVVAVLSLAADLTTKGWAKHRLDGYDAVAKGMKHIDVWKGHVELIFARNPGGAWSFLRGMPDSLRRPFFLVVSAAAIVFIVNIYRRIYRDQTAMKWGLPLALGGAMGNLVDRIRYGWVVDFIDFSMKWGGHEHHWPTFNVADIAIVLGVGLMALDMLRSRGLHPHEDAPTSARPADLPTASPSS